MRYAILCLLVQLVATVSVAANWATKNQNRLNQGVGWWRMCISILGAFIALFEGKLIHSLYFLGRSEWWAVYYAVYSYALTILGGFMFSRFFLALDKALDQLISRKTPGGIE